MLKNVFALSICLLALLSACSDEQAVVEPKNDNQRAVLAAAEQDLMGRDQYIVLAKTNTGADPGNPLAIYKPEEDLYPGHLRCIKALEKNKIISFARGAAGEIIIVSPELGLDGRRDWNDDMTLLVGSVAGLKPVSFSGPLDKGPNRDQEVTLAYLATVSGLPWYTGEVAEACPGRGSITMRYLGAWRAIKRLSR